MREETTKPIIIDISQRRLHGLRRPRLRGQRLHFLPDEIGGAFGITGLTERIKTLFAVTHVDGLLPCFERLESAEASVKNSKPAVTKL